MSKAVWFLSRGTGMTSLVLLTVVLVLGILTRSGRPLPNLPRFVTAGLHRNASLLAVSLLAVHVLTAVADPYSLTGFIGLVVPFTGAYRPLYVGLGTLAFDLVLGLVVTSLLRLRIPDRAWRAVHWLAYACWPLAVVHGWGSGTDAGRTWGLAVIGGSVLAGLAAVAYRTSSGHFPSDATAVAR